MKVRIARKVLSGKWSKKFVKHLEKLHPPYYDDQGRYFQPSRHAYYRIWKAWVIVKRKARKYQENFKLL